MYALKAVQTVVLRKGGKDVTFVTHSPFNKTRYLDVPLAKVGKYKLVSSDMVMASFCQYR